jgi:hypothetical protein
LLPASSKARKNKSNAACYLIKRCVVKLRRASKSKCNIFSTMPATTIRVPENLTAFTVFPFCRVLQSQRPTEELIFDFSQTKTVEPFGMLVAASEIKRCVAAHPEAKFTCKNYQRMPYAGHMGFFKAFGLDFGRKPGEAFGSRNYIPLTYFNSLNLTHDAKREGLDVGDVVELHSRRLSQTLAGADEGDLFETLSYSIREIMRNVVEHAHVEEFGVCAQYWPTKGRAEVAIVDRGIGLRESIKANPHIDASTDKSAINYALMPAVSGKAFKGARSLQKRGPWTNSGFGLYLTSRICRNGGNFFICSGDTGMLLTSGRDSKRYIETSFSGAAVRLNIRTENLDSLRDALARYRADGFEIQQKYKEIVQIDPSSASLMLSQDFDLSLWNKLLTNLKLR